MSSSITLSRLTGDCAARLLMLTFCAATLTGCSNAEGDIYKALKCGRVANILGRTDQAKAAARKMERLFPELPDKYRNNKSQFFMMLTDRFTDDLGLYKLSPQGQAAEITDVYESGTCQKIYE